MSSEVSFDTATVGLGWTSTHADEGLPSTTLHDGIFSPPPYPLFQSNHEFKGTRTTPETTTDQRMS